MNGCNTNNDSTKGAITTVSEVVRVHLQWEYVNIADSRVNLIKTDLQMITISDVTATNPNINDQYSGVTKVYHYILMI